MTRASGVLAAVVVAAACRPPPRAELARDPGAPAVRDPSLSDPPALAIADRVFAAAGGARWDQARELRWTRTDAAVAAVDRLAPPPPPLAGIVQGTARAIDRALDRDRPAAAPAADRARHLWDRWNGRYAVRTGDGARTLTAALDIYRDDLRLLVGDADHGTGLAGVISEHDGGIRAMWPIDSLLISLPFALHDPSARLAYVGPMYGATGEVDRLRLTFAPGDRARAELVVELIVSRSSAIEHVEVSRRGTPWRVGYDLRDWITVAGLAIPTTLDAGDGNIVRFSDIAVDPRVTDDDFVWPSSR